MPGYSYLKCAMCGRTGHIINYQTSTYFLDFLILLLGFWGYQFFFGHRLSTNKDNTLTWFRGLPNYRSTEIPY